MKFFEKIQTLSIEKRKIIFWLILVIFGFILFFFWIRSVQKNIRGLQTEKFLKEIKFPELQEKIETLPKPEIKGSLEEIEKSFQEIEQKIPGGK